eukprot:CAMPEP_0177687650 /NCGR_PEP_ID=MMETSP0447-20121125/34239_1 /TAXON_ID=0 /ORGANISM="Stygamoeba regulata, Strain BSH-02190019" /LENGTH=261 /DNA_ID=CAMNT_0019197901 /DNA_START=186 /DNA_END=971 /DNA_ORIENTATION=-
MKVSADTMVRCLLLVDQHVWAALPMVGKIMVRDIKRYKKVKSIQLYEQPTESRRLGTLLAREKAPTVPINCMHLHKHFVWIGSMKKIFVVHGQSRKLQGLWDAHLGRVLQIISVDCQVWSCSDQGDICAWCETDASLLWTGNMHSSKVLSLCVLDDWVLSGSADSTIIMWDPKTHTPIGEVKGESRGDAWRCFAVYENEVWAGTLSNSIYVWSHEKGFISSASSSLSSSSFIRVTNESGRQASAEVDVMGFLLSQSSNVDI